MRALAAALNRWSVTFQIVDDGPSGHERPVAVIVDDLGRESWVFLDFSIYADPAQSADEVAAMIMDNEHWSRH